MAKKKQSDVLIYKDFPLVKRGNNIIYGDVNGEYYIRMTVMSNETIVDLEVADNIFIELVETKNNSTVKKAEREGMYKAMDIAEFWLKDALGV